MRSFNFTAETSENLSNETSQRYETPVIDLLKLNLSAKRPLTGYNHFKSSFYISAATDLDTINYISYNFIFIDEAIDIATLNAARLVIINNIANTTGITSFLVETLGTVANTISTATAYNITGCMVDNVSDLTTVNNTDLLSCIKLSDITATPVIADVVIVGTSDINSLYESSIDYFYATTLNEIVYTDLGLLVTTQNDADDFAINMYCYDIDFMYCENNIIEPPLNLNIYVGENKYRASDSTYDYMNTGYTYMNPAVLSVETDVGKIFVSQLTGNYIFNNELARVAYAELTINTDDSELEQQLIIGSYIKTSDRLPLTNYGYELYEGQQLYRYVRIAGPSDCEYNLYFKLSSDIDLYEWASTDDNLNVLPEWMDWRNKYTIETMTVSGTGSSFLVNPSKRMVQPISITASNGSDITITSFNENYIYTNSLLMDDEYIIKFQARANAWIITNEVMALSKELKDCALDIRMNNVVDFPTDYYNGLCSVYYDNDISTQTFEIYSNGLPVIKDELIYESLPIAIAEDESQFIHSLIPAVLPIQEEYQYIVCNNLGLYPNNVWTPLDEWGLLLSTPRHNGEDLARYRLRLLDVFNHHIGSNQEGMEYGIFRELCPTGMDTNTFDPDNEV